METPVLVASWRDGAFAVGKKRWDHELAGCSVRALTTDGKGGALAVVNGHSLRRRTAEGAWLVLATAEAELACCVAAQGSVYVGTEDARVLRLNEKHELVALPGFDAAPGRQTWYAGQALVDGQLMGPPLGVRSIAATPGGVLLANVHVGGIPRSTDAGATWFPTLPVDADVHEVRAHPSHSNIVAAAAAVGLCTSTDGGVRWQVQTDGLHASYCSAVAFVEDDVLVAASASHFAPQGRIYRRSLRENVPLRPVAGGLPEWTEGIVDTHFISVGGARVALADHAGNLYVSEDAARSWSRWATALPAPSSVHVP